MRKCISCGRVYSDMVDHCPTCGVDLTGGSAAPGTNADSQDPDALKTVVKRWRAAACIFAVLTLFFAGLFAWKSAEYRQMENAYFWEVVELRDIIASRDPEEKYTIDVTACYSGDDEYTWISDELDADELDCICIEWSVHDETKSWNDVHYLDFITSSGEVLMPTAENNGHTQMIDLSGTDGTTHGRMAWFRMGDWKAGTYRVIFYQGDRAVDSYEFEVD